MKNNTNLTPEQLEFLSLWSQGYSYVDIAKQIGKDVSTLRRWRKREDIQLAMGAISQQKYEDTLHRDALVMEKLALSVFSKIDEASAKDVFWLYQSLSKKESTQTVHFLQMRSEWICLKIRILILVMM